MRMLRARHVNSKKIARVIHYQCLRQTQYCYKKRSEIYILSKKPARNCAACRNTSVIIAICSTRMENECGIGIHNRDAVTDLPSLRAREVTRHIYIHIYMHTHMRTRAPLIMHASWIYIIETHGAASCAKRCVIISPWALTSIVNLFRFILPTVCLLVYRVIRILARRT